MGRGDFLVFGGWRACWDCVGGVLEFGVGLGGFLGWRGAWYFWRGILLAVGNNVKSLGIVLQ